MLETPVAKACVATMHHQLRKLLLKKCDTKEAASINRIAEYRTDSAKKYIPTS
jgi:hypothetical protein